MASRPGLELASCGVCAWWFSGMLYRPDLCNRFLDHPLALSFHRSGARTPFAPGTEGLAPSHPREAGLTSNLEGIAARVPGAF